MRRDEVCPECHSPDICVGGFDEEEASYQCNKCRYRWIEPRRLSDGIIKSHYDVTCEECSQQIVPPLRCFSIGGKHHTEALFFVCPRCGQVYYDEGDFVVKKFFKRRMTRKVEVASLEDFCQKFEEFKDDKMLVRPYLPKIVGEGEHDFGIIVECEHAIYEIGLSGYHFRDHSLLPAWKREKPRKKPSFDFASVRRKIGRFETSARNLSMYLAEKGYPPILLEIQHLDRIPRKAAGDSDMRIFIHQLGGGMKDFMERGVWGSVGGFLYGIVYNVRDSCRTFDVYVVPSPEERIVALPFENPENKVNPKEFVTEAAARHFLKEYLIKEKKVPEERISEKLLDTYRFWRPPYRR